jgi:hypothetical protein
LLSKEGRNVQGSLLRSSSFSPGRNAAEARRFDELLGTNPLYTTTKNRPLSSIGVVLMSKIFVDVLLHPGNIYRAAPAGSGSV